MSDCSKLLATNTGRCWLLQSIARMVFGAAFVVLVASKTTKADDQQHSVVARVDTKGAGLTQGELAVRVGNVNVPATAIKASPEIPRNIVIVIDAGPNQATVLSRERTRYRLDQ